METDARASVESLLVTLAACKRECSEIHNAYDRTLYAVVLALAEQVATLNEGLDALAQDTGLGIEALTRVLNARTEHLA